MIEGCGEEPAPKRIRSEALDTGSEHSSADAPPLRITWLELPAWHIRRKESKSVVLTSHRFPIPYGRPKENNGRRTIENILFSECVPRYPVEEKLVEKLQGHDVLYVVSSPRNRRHPVRRDRLLMAGLNKQKVIWVGRENYRDDFKNKFHRAVELDGSVFSARPKMTGTQCTSSVRTAENIF